MNQDFLRHLKKKSNEGQSTIEFVATLSFAITFLFLFFQVSLNFTNGYIIQFATYQASRAYLSFDEGRDSSTVDAETLAEEVFKGYHDLMESSLRQPAVFGINPPDVNGGALRALYVGAHSEWSGIFSLSNVVGGKHDIKFLSEAYLGKEPTQADCHDRICEAMGCEEAADDTIEDSIMNFVTIHDNGC